MLVAVGADDLFGKVGIAVHVLAPQRNSDGHAPLRLRYTEAETAQNRNHVRMRHRNAEHGVDCGIPHLDGLGLKRIGVDVGAAGSGLAAAELPDKMKRAVHGKAARPGIHALFKAGGGIAALTQRAGRPAHVVAGELCRLEEHFLGIGFNFAVEPAHDARKRNALFLVADEQVLGREREFFFVQRGDLLACLCTADDNARPLRDNFCQRRAWAGPSSRSTKLVISTMSDTDRSPQSARRRRIQRGEVPIFTSAT